MFHAGKILHREMNGSVFNTLIEERFRLSNFSAAMFDVERKKNIQQSILVFFRYNFMGNYDE